VPPRVVVDASIAIPLVLADPLSDAATSLFHEWRQQNTALFAPQLWAYETASVLRKAVAKGRISTDEVSVPISGLWRLGVELVPPTEVLLAQAVRWAGRLGQTAAYDAAHVALAEQLDCPLWTGDKRLAIAAARADVLWVHLLGGPAEGHC